MITTAKTSLSQIHWRLNSVLASRAILRMKLTLQFSGNLKKHLLTQSSWKKTLMLYLSTLLSMIYHSEYLFMNSIASKILLKWHPFEPNNTKLPKTNRNFLSISKYLQSSNYKPWQLKGIWSHRLSDLTSSYYSYRNYMYLGGSSFH